MHYKDKVVWITGASSGLGKEFAIQLAKKGAIIVLSARTESKLIEIKQRLVNSEKHIVFPIDYENYQEFPALVSALLKLVPKIDCLINNAGVSQRSNIIETPIWLDEKMITINYIANIALSKALLGHFVQCKSGQIIVISSLSGKFGFYMRSSYSAAKHALQGFYETLRLEHWNDNIKVTIAYPSFIKTNVSENSLTASGTPHGKVDVNHQKGMEVNDCVKEIIKAAEKEKFELVLGPEAKKGWLFKRFFPSLFWKIIKLKSGTGS